MVPSGQLISRISENPQSNARYATGSVPACRSARPDTRRICPRCPAGIVAALLFFLAGPLAALAAVTAVLAGTVLSRSSFPSSLHGISRPKDFSWGSLPLSLLPSRLFRSHAPGWVNAAGAVMALLIMPAVTAYLALNFTGCNYYLTDRCKKRDFPLCSDHCGHGRRWRCSGDCSWREPA